MVGRRRVGILALQGDFAAHGRTLEDLCETRLVTTALDLERDGGIDGLILPGGESTTQIRLLRLSGLWERLARLGAEGLPMFGTCAGAILLAREVEGQAGRPRQESLGLLDVSIRRNAYGRQVDSFETEVPSLLDPDRPLSVVCIRAPRFTRLGGGVEVLCALGDEPLLVRQARLWAATFHPELGADRRVHEAFVGSL